MKEYQLTITQRTPRPRSERLRRLGIASDAGTASGTSSAGSHSPCSWDEILNKPEALFEKVNIGTDTAPVWTIRAKYGLYSDSFVSAKGAGSSSGGGGLTDDLIAGIKVFSECYVSDAQVEAVGGDLFKLIQDRIDEGYTYIDCRSLNTGKTYHVTGYGRQPDDIDGTPLVDANGDAIRGALVIDKPCEVVLNVGTIQYSGQHHMIIFACDGCKITGHNRMGRTNDPEGGSTILKMTNNGSTDLADNGYHMPRYHIYCRGYNNSYIQNLTLRGIRSDRGCQFGSVTKPLLGCGGIYMEKPNPMRVSSGNTVNNLQIVNVAIFDTIAHGIYVNTPILSNLRNVRVSGAGGFGVFIHNGTTLTLDTVFVTSANFGGFLIMGLSYLTLLNCASENSGLGYWLRSCQNVTGFSPGAEELVNLGANMWSDAYTETGVFGLNLSTTGGIDTNGNTDDRGTVMPIKDVNSDYYTRFRGTAFLITGGVDISMMTPYATVVGAPLNKGMSTETFFMRVDGNCRGLYVLNPGFHFNSAFLDSVAASGKVPSIRNEIYISAAITGATIYYNVDQLNCLQDLVAKFGDSYGTLSGMITTSSTAKAPIRIAAGGDIEVKVCNRYFTTDGTMNILYKEAPEVSLPTEIESVAFTWDTTAGHLGVHFTTLTNGEILSAKIATSTSLIDTSDPDAVAALPSVAATLLTENSYQGSVYVTAKTWIVVVISTNNVVGDTVESYSNVYSIETNGRIVDETTGDVIQESQLRDIVPTLISYDSAANTYQLSMTWSGFGVVTSAGAAYSTTNTSPTTAQNDAKGTIAADGQSATLSIKGSSTQRYVRFYVGGEYSDTYVLSGGNMTIYTA